MEINLQKIRKIISWCIAIFCLYLICESGWSTYISIKEERLTREVRAAYEKAKEEAQATPMPTPTPKPTPTPTPVPTPLAPEQPVPPVQSEKVLRKEYEILIEEYGNEDIVGYLSVAGTSIDYPVLQYKDNEFYLSRDIYKNKNSAGSIYLDYENDIAASDMNTIIYGHNMKQDIMFHAIRYYANKAFFDEHKYISFNTLYDDYIYEVFAFYVPNVSFPYIYANYDETGFDKLLQEIKEMALYDTGVEVSSADRIIHLSTCSNQSENTRMTVAAKLVKVNGKDYTEILAENQAYEKALAEYNEYISSQAAQSK